MVSRWDLQVIDTDALLRAGRAAHRRLWTKENEQHAAAAVPTAGQAVYSLLHEFGEPWFDLPGVEVVRGVRAFVRPDEPATPLSDEDDPDETIIEPLGERLIGESWARSPG